MEFEVCAICGGSLYWERTSRDHIIPVAILKWAFALNPEFTEEDFRTLYDLLNSDANICRVHYRCNDAKSDGKIDIDSLYVSDDKKKELHALYDIVRQYIETYDNFKSNLLASQNGCCYRCGTALTNHKIMRRITNDKERAKDNACLLCYDCNNWLSNHRYKSFEFRQYRAW